MLWQQPVKAHAKSCIIATNFRKQSEITFLPDMEADFNAESVLPKPWPHLVVVARVEKPIQDC